MLTEMQASLGPYLGMVGQNPWLQALTVVLASWLLAWIFDRFISSSLRKMARHTSFKIDDHLVEHLHNPIYVSVVLLGIALAVNLLKVPAPFDFIAFSILKTIAYLVWTMFVLRSVRSLIGYIAADERHITILHPQTQPLFENLAIILIIVLSVYAVFTAWNVDMTAWLASAGIVGIAVGFAAKDTLANLFSGVFIMADAPYKIGDYVVLDSGERGQITHIGIRSTRMKTRDDVEITVPNAIMGNTKIFNESGGFDEKTRIAVAVGVAYGSDIERVGEVLLKIGLEQDDVCVDPEPRVRFRRFGASGLDFELLCWIEKPELRGRILHELNSEVYKRFIEAGVEIPYSKQDLYIKELPERN